MKLVLLFFCVFYLAACSDKPKNSTAEQSSTPLPDADLSSIFPYEFKFDTLAYMSCAKQTGQVLHPHGTFFTFKIGAYNEGSGLRLSSGLADRIRGQNFFQRFNSFQSSYDKDRFDKSQWTLQLALRSSNFSNFSDILPVSANFPVINSDYNIFLYNNYGAEEILTQLLNLPNLVDHSLRPYLRYEKGVPAAVSLNPRRYFEQILRPADLQASLGLPGSKLEQLNSNEYRLSTFYTYHENFSRNENAARVTAEGFKGRSFQLSFAAVGEGSEDMRKLSSVTEHTVDDSNIVLDSANWQCDSYQVVRDKDRALCDTLSTTADQSDTPLKKAMENVWGATGFWKFNHAKKCAVYQLSEAITDSLTRRAYNVCYDENSLLLSENPPQPGQDIAYQSPLVTGTSVSCDSTNPAESLACPHFLSACWR